jgi:voltage-gated potassium channel
MTTVGYGETLPVHDNASAQVFTLLLIILGMGVVLYFVSTLTAFILEGSLSVILRRNRMDKIIARLSGHTIVCGGGATGEHVVQELLDSGAPLVVIDGNSATIEHLLESCGREVPFIVGDATEDHCLILAGVERCKSVVVTLSNDHDNLYCTITARTLSPTARIVARVEDTRAEAKFRRAGANDVVHTKAISGRRMASAVLRPRAMDYMDLMLRGQERPLRVEEVEISEDSPVANKSLREAAIRRCADVLIIAIYDSANESYTYNPAPDFVIRGGHVLIVIGELGQVRDLDEKLRCVEPL